MNGHYILLILLYYISSICIQCDFINNDKIAIYRLIGNDMPPLQSVGQLRWNTEYALVNEEKFIGARKKWILNRIWNDTEFTLIYDTLINNGVRHKDIIVRCFDIDIYERQKTPEDKLFYLTSQNEGRNTGIIDGRENNFEWSVILDGNTFITSDSWYSIKAGLQKAAKQGQTYMKIPYHRVIAEQSRLWLNTSSTMNTVVQYAPMKGESQIAFHYNAKEIFSLNDTNPGKKNVAPKKGYGQRNKSYLFKDGEVCGKDSTKCACSDVAEGNEQDLHETREDMMNYTTNCGLVLRLWSYPTDNVITTGLFPEEEIGFHCYFNKYYDTFLIPKLPLCDKSKLQKGQKCDHDIFPSFCNKMIYAANQWRALPEGERNDFRNNSNYNDNSCKEELKLNFIKQSCVRSQDRDRAQQDLLKSLEILQSKYKFNAIANGYGSTESTCDIIYSTMH